MHRRFAALFFTTTLALTGCAGSYGAPPVAATFLYTVAGTNFDLTSSFLNSYPVASTGSAVAATNSAPLLATDVGRGVQGDGMGNLYTLSTTEHPTCCVMNVNVYGAANGVLTLKRSFFYSNSSTQALSFAVDPTGIVYVSAVVGTTGTLLKFAANASGAATPTMINTAGFEGGPGYFFRMATDPAGDLYTYAGGDEVWEYTAGDTSGTPSKVLTLFAFGTTTISVFFSDMAIDSAGNIYLLGQSQGIGFPPFISEYSSAAGTTTPMKTINGPSTLMRHPVALAVDAVGNIYEEDSPTFSGTAHSDTILTFPASATGNTAPTNVFTVSAIDSNAAPSNVRTGLVAY